MLLVVQALPMAISTLFAVYAFYQIKDPLFSAVPTHSDGRQPEPDARCTVIVCLQALSDIIQASSRYRCAKRNIFFTVTTSSDTPLVAITWRGQQSQQVEKEHYGQESEALPHLRA